MTSRKLKLKALSKLAATVGEVPQKALDNEALKIEAALSSASRYDLLEEQLELLNAISFRVPEKAFEIVFKLIDRLKTLEIKYPDKGYDGEDVKKFFNDEKLTNKSLEIVERIRYFIPEKAIDLFFTYSSSSSTEIAKQAIGGIEALAKYDREIFYSNGKGWQGLGTQPQEIVINRLEKLSHEDKKKYLDVVTTATNQILSPVIEGTDWNYKTVTFRSGAVPAIEQVIQVRKKALALLKSAYCEAATIENKKHILNSLSTSTRTPHMEDYGKEVDDMVVGDTIEVMDFLKSIVADPSEDLQIIQKIEHDTYYRYRRERGHAIEKSALETKEQIDNHTEYQVFKILIGFEGVFHDWQTDKDLEVDDFKNVQDLREGKADEFAASINDDNYNEWKDRIIKYASIKSNDLATFPIFGRFLEKFSEFNPRLAFRMLSECEEQLGNFIIAFIIGLLKSSEKEKSKELLISWVDAQRNLYQIARAFEYINELDEKILKGVFDAAKASNQLHVLRQIISTVSAQYSETTKKYITELLLPAIKILTTHKRTDWVHAFWFRKQQSQIFSMLTEQEQKEILSNLAWVEKIDYEVEAILTQIAKLHPVPVMRFFEERLNIVKEMKRERDFQAIPFSFHTLQKPLSEIPNEATDIILNSFDGNYGLFIYRGARLLKNIFPAFESYFSHKLLSLVKVGDEKIQKFVMAILRNYEGNPRTHEVVKELIKNLPDDSILRNELNFVLMSTGVVSGEYGFVNAYKRKIEEIKPWLNDKDAKVQAFAKNYISMLERQIEHEKKRADNDILLRKHRYGVDLEESNSSAEEAPTENDN